MEKTQLEKAVSKLAAKLQSGFTVNADGTISTNEPTYDISGINDYITMLIHQAQDSAERAYKLGGSKGYAEGRSAAERHYRAFPYGEFGFTDGKQRYLVRITEGSVTAYGVTKNNLLALENIPLAEIYDK